MYDYYLGGGHNFAADREAAQRMIDLFPDLPRITQANRAFLRRAVAFLVEQGIDQFLDIGSGIPTAGNVHEVAQRANPAARVVYVDIDPVAVTQSRTLLHDNPRAGVVLADARATEQILADPVVERLIDLARPVGVLAMSVLHFFADEAEACGITQRLYERVPSGSYLALSHATTERITDDMRREVDLEYSRTTSPMVFRTREQIRRLFAGFELIEPGLVYIPEWRPEGPEEPFYAEPKRSNGYGGVGRRP
jgi:hypothetical protein